MIKIRSLLTSISGFIVGAAAVCALYAAAAPAQADPPGLGCLDHEWGEGGMEAIVGTNTSPNTGASGVIADTHVADTKYCQRISSLYVVDGSSPGAFEFGWVWGYSGCNNLWYSQPTMFEVYVTDTGAAACEVYASETLATGQSDVLRASDANRNGIFGGYVNGVEVSASVIDLGWIGGGLVVATERQNVNESGYGRWTDLQEHHNGDGWTSWDNARDADPAYATSTDPDFHWDREGANVGRVIHD